MRLDVQKFSRCTNSVSVIKGSLASTLTPLGLNVTNARIIEVG